MKLAIPVRPCNCRERLARFLHVWTIKNKQPMPPTGSIIECDCGEYFKMNVRGNWQKGDWSAEFGGMEVAVSSA